jgi:hypothetical protein
MSNRDAPAAISSIAQHANPIGMGHNEFFLIQLMDASSLVMITFPSIFESYPNGTPVIASFMS